MWMSLLTLEGHLSYILSTVHQSHNMAESQEQARRRPQAPLDTPDLSTSLPRTKCL